MLSMFTRSISAPITFCVWSRQTGIHPPLEGHAKDTLHRPCFMPSPLQRRNLFRKWLTHTMLGLIGGGILCLLTVPAGFLLLGDLLIRVKFCGYGQSAIGCLFFGAIFAGGLTVGFSVGLAQWFVLKRFLQRARWWILASTLGWMGIFFTLCNLFYTPILNNGVVLQAIDADALSGVAGLLGAGALMGLFQWLLMDLPLVRSWSWIALHICLALLAALAVTSGLHPGGGVTGASVFMVLSFPMYAVISGAVLSRLMGNLKVVNRLSQAT
ncbi:hypothetical protein AM1_2000 [Acaryochloris marina MBIC11017]|uniref:Uncharacterized protein n=2 Tax=Acaryochloris marina TaxID=155978 RepID=B0CFJ6_ACAM1|nr:hypothetical protein AM1_2000 [Acaryochloris marina MBIC11017]